jgi:hypothetical protein
MLLSTVWILFILRKVNEPDLLGLLEPSLLVHPKKILRRIGQLEK